MTKKMITPLFLLTATLAAFSFSGCTTAPDSAMPSAGYQLDASQSTLNFVTTKAGQPGTAAVIESQSFKRFSGGVDALGRINLDIDLASVDTGIEIRDERLKTMLWNVKLTPRASFTAKLPSDVVTSFSTAGFKDIEVAGTLQMAGLSKPVSAKLRVLTSGQKMSVVTREPILVNANDFGLKPGVEALREVMGLNVLSPAAPVTFSLSLNSTK
jgi:polyisoprenoid-binding protein YceI